MVYNDIVVGLELDLPAVAFVYGTIWSMMTLSLSLNSIYPLLPSPEVPCGL